jgi:hypothetical protein
VSAGLSLGPNSLLIPLQLPHLSRRIEHPLNVPIERPQHADARHHGWPAEFDDQEQGFYRGLPLGEILLGLGSFWI